MKKIEKLCYLLLLLILTVSSCRKDEILLCYMNDELWVAKVFFGANAPLRSVRFAAATHRSHCKAPTK